MLVEVKFSIFVTQEFIFLGMIDNICESFVAVLSILYLCTVVNFEALSGIPRGLQSNPPPFNKCTCRGNISD